MSIGIKVAVIDEGVDFSKYFIIDGKVTTPKTPYELIIKMFQ